MRASRPTTTPFEAEGSLALTSAADAAAIAAEADVPVTEPEPEEMSTPGAAKKVSAPEFEPVHRVSSRSVAETPTTLAMPAGKVAVVERVVAGGGDEDGALRPCVVDGALERVAATGVGEGHQDHVGTVIGGVHNAFDDRRSPGRARHRRGP